LSKDGLSEPIPITKQIQHRNASPQEVVKNIVLQKPRPTFIGPQIKLSNQITCIITQQDSTGHRLALGARRVPAWASKFSLPKIKRTFIVDPELSHFTINGRRVLFYDIDMPSPITFTEKQAKSMLRIEGQILDSVKLYEITETTAIEKLVTASTTMVATFDWKLIILGLIMGVAVGFALYPIVFHPATTIVTQTVTVTTTVHP
jgi:hypothetical protein